MKRFIIMLIIQCPILFLFGQDDFCNCTVDQSLLFEAVLTGQKFQMKRTSGTQLFQDASFKGDIILASGDTVRDKQIGYNGYEDELIWTKPDNLSMVKVDKAQVDKFTFYDINDKEHAAFRHLQGTTSGKRQIDFFAQILLEDSLSLYARHNIQFVEKIEQDDGNIITLIDRIEPMPPVYYIRLPDNKYLEIKHIRKKSLYKALPDYKESIKTLLTMHHQALRKEHDLIRTVQLFNKYGLKSAEQKINL